MAKHFERQRKIEAMKFDATLPPAETFCGTRRDDEAVNIPLAGGIQTAQSIPTPRHQYRFWVSL